MKIEFEALAATSAVVTTSSCIIHQVHGRFNGSTADRWLQLFDAKALPADGAPPLRVFPLYQTAPFEWNFSNGISFVYGCVIAVSTTQATLTISADTMDIFANGDQAWDNTGLLTIGDYTTGTNGRTIWTNNNGPKTLRRLEFTPLTIYGGTLYAKVHSFGFVFPTYPIIEIPLPDATSVDFYFNLVPRQVYPTVTAYKGCYVYINAASGVIVNDYAGSHFAIKGTYV